MDKEQNKKEEANIQEVDKNKEINNNNEMLEENTKLKETTESEKEEFEVIKQDYEDSNDKTQEEKQDELEKKSEVTKSKEEYDVAEEYDDIDENDMLTPTEKKKKINKILIIVFAIVLSFVLIFFCGIACVNKMNANVYKNVYVLGINMSGKTQEEVYNVLDYISNMEESEKIYDNNIESKKQKISNLNLNLYQDNEKIYSLTSNDINFNIDVERTLKSIMSFGRNKNIIVNNFEILKAFFTQKEIEPTYKYDTTKLEEICKNVELTIKNRFVDDKYSIDEQNNKLIITRGITGNTINIEMEKEKILGNFSNQVKHSLNEEVNDLLHLSIIERKPNSINLDEMYNNVKREAKDAYIDKESNPIKLVKEEIGYDLDIEEVRTLLTTVENKQEGKVIEVSLKVIEPKVKLQDITYTLYKDKLAGYTTYFDPSQWARANNLAIALEYLNDKIIMPGEIFSYNATIGDTTVAKGYKAAATFKGGRVVQELGGGICQTTSTLYNVALMANLEIVERHQHGLPVGYVPPSRDATVYSPNLDFKFKNTRKYPVKIVTSFSNSGSLNISIFGTKEENEYEVILSHKYLSTIPFTTQYEYDETMPEGTQIIVSNGVNGYTSESYITKKLNGTVTYSGILSQDKYNAQQQIVKIGTKKEQM